jgi:uncharacterized integral membrane protein
MSTYGEDHQLDSRRGARDVGQIVRLVIVLVVVALIVAIAVDNRDDVRFGYVIGDATIPIWLLVVASAIGGVLIGWLIRHRPRRD